MFRFKNSNLHLIYLLEGYINGIFNSEKLILKNMNFKLLIILVVFIGATVYSQEVSILDCAQGNWAKCGFDIAKLVFKLHKWNDKPYEFCGYRCKSSLKGRVRKLKWVWDGKINCDGLGEGLGRGAKSRKGASERALNNLVTKLNPQKLTSLNDCVSKIKN